MTSQQYLHLSHIFTFATSGATAPVIGNGLSLGLTNGTDFYSLHNSDEYKLAFYSGNYGQAVPTVGSGYWVNGGFSTAVTTDPTKSGMVASFSNITLGDIPSLQLGKFFIKY